MRDAPEMLPCPFCGGKATWAYGSRGWKVECEGRFGSCTMNARTHYQPVKDMAIAAWNRRATPAALAEAPEVKALIERAILDAQLRCLERGRIDTPDEIRAEAAALAEAPEVAALIREAKTQLVALVGVTATRDTATGEPLMWGDKDGDCLSPEIALQERVAALIREAEARGVERAAQICTDAEDNIFGKSMDLRTAAITIRAEAAALRKGEKP